MFRSCLYSLLVFDQKNKKSPELAKNPTQQFFPTWSSFVFWLYKKVFPPQYINLIKWNLAFWLGYSLESKDHGRVEIYSFKLISLN